MVVAERMRGTNGGGNNLDGHVPLRLSSCTLLALSASGDATNGLPFKEDEVEEEARMAVAVVAADCNWAWLLWR